MRADLPITSLILDVQNPRLEVQQSQRDSLRELFASEAIKKKMIRLVEDIVEHGTLNPLEKIGVSETETKGRYVVHEGNRRVAALQILHNPNLLDGAVSGSTQKKLRELSTKYLKGNPPDDIECEVLPLEQLKHWITLRHTGENEGAGIVEWGSIEKGRYLERGGAVKPIEMQFLEQYLSQTGGDENEAKLVKKVPATSVRRLLDSKPVREKFGITLEKGWAYSEYPAAEMFKWLRKVVHDFATGKKKVRDIYNNKAIANYLDEFSTHELPNAKTALKDAVPVAPIANAQGTKSPKQTGKKKVARWSLRAAKIQPDHSRLQDILRELEHLPYDRSNIHSVMTRVFLELSVDDFNTRHKVIVTPDSKGKTPLKSRVLAAVQFAEKQGWLDRPKAAAIRQVTAGNLLGSTQTLNEFVHNKNIHPSASDVETGWKNLAPFLSALHSH